MDLISKFKDFNSPSHDVLYSKNCDENIPFTIDTNAISFDDEMNEFRLNNKKCKKVTGKKSHLSSEHRRRKIMNRTLLRLMQQIDIKNIKKNSKAVIIESVATYIEKLHHEILLLRKQNN